jgi:hypothetical protein
MNISRLTDWRILVLSVLAMFGLLLLIDYWLPLNQDAEIIVHFKSYTQSSRSSSHTVWGIVTDKEQIPCSRGFNLDVNIGDTILVGKTAIIKNVSTIEHSGHIQKGFYSIYNAYCLFPTILFLSSVAGIVLRLRQNDNYQKAIGLASILAIYLLVAIFTNRII